MMLKIEFWRIQMLLDLKMTSRIFIFKLEALITRPLKKYMPVIPFPPVLPYRFTPSSGAHPSFKSAERDKGGDGRDPTPKNMGALMPAVKSRCER
jgi:hypothetical protein